METDEYPVRYVAFLDILGFRDLVTRLNRDHSQVAFIHSLMMTLHQPAKGLEDLVSGSDLRVQSISDAVAISSSSTISGLVHLFSVIELLSVRLLPEGILLRGAVVKDRLFHDHRMVFGEGLVRAYHYESKVARFPRIMLTREVAGDINKNFVRQKRPFFDRQVRQSADGPTYWHLLRRYEEIKTRPLNHPKRPERLASLVAIRDKLQARLDEAVDTPAHFEKVRWFAQYWNNVFYGVEGLKKIEGAEPEADSP